MKGEAGVGATCPKCGAAVNPRAPLRTKQHNQTTRTITRHAVREHVIAHHPELSPRQVSLLLDEVCDLLERKVAKESFFLGRSNTSTTDAKPAATEQEDDSGRPTDRRRGSSQ